MKFYCPKYVPSSKFYAFIWLLLSFIHSTLLQWELTTAYLPKRFHQKVFRSWINNSIASNEVYANHNFNATLNAKLNCSIFNVQQHSTAVQIHCKTLYFDGRKIVITYLDKMHTEVLTMLDSECRGGRTRDGKWRNEKLLRFSFIGNSREWTFSLCSSKQHPMCSFRTLMFPLHTAWRLNNAITMAHATIVLMMIITIIIVGRCYSICMIVQQMISRGKLIPRK